MVGGYSKHRVRAIVAAVALATCEVPSHAQEHDDAPHVDRETVYYDSIDDAGRLIGGSLMLPVDAAVAEFRSNRAVLDNRIDLVTVGDGYQASQLPLYAIHATSAVNAFFAQQPFARYQHFYRVHQVNVVSVDSGVDNDPTPGILRNTAMDMAFWCSGIERLLCINVTQAYQFASAAPDVDHLLAIANSDKYGGAGYTASDLATVAGGNGAAAEIAIHEFGHSLGNLADEYDYGDGANYIGPEHPSVNASILPSAQMMQSGTKWASWLNVNDPFFDGHVSTFEGCAFYQFGLYRPTLDSKMRSLGRPFNLPSVEALLIEMYKIVNPIDDSTPVNANLTGRDTIFVAPMQVQGSPALSVQWSLDGRPIDGATNATLDLASLNLDETTHMVSAVVTDPTPWVRNEATRMQWMTETRTWTVNQPPANDGCAYAVNVPAGTSSFTTIASTTDGPVEPGCGKGFQIVNDVWFKYGATCIGTVTASVCDAGFDAALSVYIGCPSAPGLAVACDHNGCASGGGPRISFPNTAVTLYRIRVGGMTSDAGSGTLVITCTPGTCIADATGNDIVDIDDLLTIINNWGATGAPGTVTGDITGNGLVNLDDLLLVINAWGPCP